MFKTLFGTRLLLTCSTKVSSVFKQSRHAQIISIIFSFISTCVPSPPPSVDSFLHHRFRRRACFARHHLYPFIALGYRPCPHITKSAHFLFTKPTLAFISLCPKYLPSHLQVCPTISSSIYQS